tara:strand:+ start:129 stop:1037 length:909 start_codon:yes stop_codon:yes gene_type:complete
MIKTFLNTFLNKISFKLFNNKLPYFYNFFNLIFNFCVRNKKLLLQKDYYEIKTFNDEGFVKIELDFDHKFDLLKKKLYEQNIIKNQNNQYRFLVDEEISNLIKDIYKSNIKFKIDKFRNYFNSEIVPAQIFIVRNYNFKNTDKEYYSNKLHMDAYLCTYFKLFINISDVGENNGPLHVVSKKRTSHLVKKLNYTDRHQYKNDEDINYHKHIGKSGSALICNTTQCFHRASVPEENCVRDMMTITLLAFPKKNIDTDTILNMNDINEIKIQNSNELIQKLKPKNLRETFSIYKQYKNFKNAQN